MWRSQKNLIRKIKASQGSKFYYQIAASWQPKIWILCNQKISLIGLTREFMSLLFYLIHQKHIFNFKIVICIHNNNFEFVLREKSELVKFLSISQQQNWINSSLAFVLWNLIYTFFDKYNWIMGSNRNF